MGNGFDDVVGRIPNTDLKGQENAHLFVQTMQELFPKIDTDKNKFVTKVELESAAANGFRGETDVQSKAINIMLKNYDLFASVSQVGECNTGGPEGCDGPSSAVTRQGIEKLAPAMYGVKDFKDVLQDNPKFETSGQVATEAVLALGGTLVGALIGSRFGFAGATVGGIIGTIAPPVAMNIGVSEYNAWKIGRQWDSKWAPQVTQLQQEVRELK